MQATKEWSSQDDLITLSVVGVLTAIALVVIVSILAAGNRRPCTMTSSYRSGSVYIRRLDGSTLLTALTPLGYVRVQDFEGTFSHSHHGGSIVPVRVVERPIHRVAVFVSPSNVCARGLTGFLEGLTACSDAQLTYDDPTVVVLVTRVTRAAEAGLAINAVLGSRLHTQTNANANANANANDMALSTTLGLSRPPRVVVLDQMDEHDTPQQMPGGVHAVFKRSVVRPRSATVHTATKPWLRHFPYCVRSAMPWTSAATERRLDVVCTLDPSSRRAAAVLLPLLKDAFPGSSCQIGRVTPKTFIASTNYHDVNAMARVIVTSEPDNWEGDFRMWESFAAGAAVAMATVHAPVQPPFLDGVHCLLFDRDAPQDVIPRIQALLDNEPTRLRMAAAAQDLVRRHHTPLARADLFFTCVSSLE